MQVDEIMLTLKQAFSQAAEWKKSNTQRQQCDTCPLLQFHRLCERIEGEKPLKARQWSQTKKKKKKENLIVICLYFS